MIPILYDHAEKDFTSQGICRLADAVDCFVTEERNGIYECEFQYPINGEFFSKIVDWIRSFLQKIVGIFGSRVTG